MPTRPVVVETGDVSPDANRSVVHGIRTVLRFALQLAVLSLGALTMLGAAFLTLFQARRFYAEVIARWIGLGLLRLWGIRYVVVGAFPEPARQVVYVSNHPSSIDPFLLIALGLPRTRFFMKGYLRRWIPIGIVGYLIGIFWTVPQAYPEERRQIFMRAERVLRKSGESVYLSPEGTRVTSGEIGPFNKGSFHLATNLTAPIVPLYIRIPEETDPGRSLDAKPGTIEVHVLPVIETREWRLEDLDQNRASVRAVFVQVHEEMRDS